MLLLSVSIVRPDGSDGFDDDAADDDDDGSDNDADDNGGADADSDNDDSGGGGSGADDDADDDGAADDDDDDGCGGGGGGGCGRVGLIGTSLRFFWNSATIALRASSDCKHIHTTGLIKSLAHTVNQNCVIS